MNPEKRDLYHAASKANVGKKKRKPLPQGRLVLEEPNQPIHQKPLVAQGQTTGTDDAQDPTISPIRSVPKLTEDTFPLVERPSQCLDLSDADESDSALQPPVLVCDASHLGISSTGTEVDVIMGYETSPVKVVCHTPGKLSRAAHLSPVARSGKKIKDADIGSGPPELTLDESQSSSHLTYKESPRPASGGRQLAFLKELSALEKLHSDASAEIACVNTKMAAGNEISKVTDNMKTEKPKEAPAGGKIRKTKSFRVVESRYMQPALNKTKSFLATSKDSSGHQKSSSRSTSNEKQLSKSGNSVQKPEDRKTSTPTFDEKSHYLDDISAIHSASTMSFCLGSVPSSRQQDTSELVFLPKQADLKLPKGKARKGLIQPKPPGGATASGFDYGNSKHPQGDLKQPVAKAKKAQPKPSGPTPLELQFEYTKYLQWAFLNLKAKKAVQEQDAAAAAELSGLWNLLESQKQELAKSQAEVSNLRRTLLAEEVLARSEHELSAAAAALPVEEYSSLSSALDTTRHQLPVKDILMPESDTEREKLEQEMEGILRESEKVLKDLKDLFGGRNEELSQYAGSLNAVDKSYTETREELKHLGKDLDDMQTLTTHMTSLFVQDLQKADDRPAKTSN